MLQCTAMHMLGCRLLTAAVHLQLLTKLRAVRVESAVSHGHAREPQPCYAEQAKQGLCFSPSLCTPVYAAV